MAQQLDPALLSQMQGSGPGGMPTQADASAAKAKEVEKEGMRQDMLTKVMAPDAKERLARISLVKPDKVPPPCAITRSQSHGPNYRPRHSHAPLKRDGRATMRQARKLEEMVMMMAQRGQLREQLSDAQLKQMLEQIGGTEV